MINIINAALPMCAQTEKMTFHAKTTSAKLYIYIGVGVSDLYIDKAHTALDILRFAVFLIWISFDNNRYFFIIVIHLIV